MAVKKEDGFIYVPLVDVGTRLRDNFGLTIKEHPYFDKVDPVHKDNSYHYKDLAIDVQDWRPDVIDGVDWKTRTKNLEKLFQGSATEVLGPSSGFPGHDKHLHLAVSDGQFKFTPQQYDYLFGGSSGGQNSLFALADPSLPQMSDKPENAKAVADATERTKNYAEMTGQELNTKYDELRKSDPKLAAIEGMKMHKAYFNKK